jgi:hypothetical protein
MVTLRRMIGGVLSISILAILAVLAKSDGQRQPPAPTARVIVVTAEPTKATQSPRPSVMPTATPAARPIFIRASNYWPPAGGHNCAYFVEGQCLSRMSSGEPWQRWIGRAISCPPEWPFGTVLFAGQRTWVCLDRGGRIRYVDGIPWVDFLTDKPFANYGEIVEAVLYLPVHVEGVLPTPEPVCMAVSCLFNPSP